MIVVPIVLTLPLPARHFSLLEYGETPVWCRLCRKTRGRIGSTHK